MIAWMMCGFALATEQPPGQRHGQVPPTPMGEAEDTPIFGVFETQDVVVVRGLGLTLEQGLSDRAFEAMLDTTLVGRHQVDFLVVLQSDRLTDDFYGAGAFYRRKDYEPEVGSEEIYGALWMNQIGHWDDYGSDVGGAWVFGQELSHHWLAFAEFDQGEGPDTALLGRDLSHWSYFLDTPNSPAEGNRWIDNGDGSFTTDIAAQPAFGELDLYLMGLIEAESVAPLSLIVPGASVSQGAASRPEHLFSSDDMTVLGSRLMVDIDDIIAVQGPVSTPFAGGPYTLLPILVLGPNEPLLQQSLDVAHASMDLWTTEWFRMTDGLSQVDFAVLDELRPVPVAPTGPTLVPRSAW